MEIKDSLKNVELLEDEGVIIKTKACNFREFQEGFAILELQDGAEFAYINTNGYIEFKLNCYSAFPFFDGLAKIEIEPNKYGFIDKTGKYVIPCIYDDAHLFQEGIAAVKKDGFWGAIDKNGNTVIPFKYNNLSNCKDGMISTSPGKVGSFDYINVETNEFISNPYCICNQFRDGLISVFKDGKYGYMDKKGEIVIPFVYQFAENFNDGLALVCENNLYGYIDKTGKIIIPCVYERVNSFSNGYAAVKNTDRWYIIDKNCTRIEIEKKYDDVYTYSDGLAVVSKNRKYGYIDSNGKEVIPCIYDNACEFVDGIATVRIGNTILEINKKNQVIFSSKYIKCSTISSDDKELDTKRLYSMANYCQLAESVELYYDLIVNDSIMTFENKEEREKMKANIQRAQKIMVLH